MLLSTPGTAQIFGGRIRRTSATALPATMSRHIIMSDVLLASISISLLYAHSQRAGFSLTSDRAVPSGMPSSTIMGTTLVRMWS